MNTRFIKRTGNKSISFIDKYFPFKKEHAETGISLIDYLKSKKSKIKK